MLKIAFNHLYAHPLPTGHRFPMGKYELLPQQLLLEGTVEKENFYSPENAGKEDILRAHTKEYLEKLLSLNLSKKEIRATGFPLSQGLVDREIAIMGGTIQSACFALEYGIASNIAGGTHHAFSNKGEGFCLLNDIAIAAKYIQAKKGIKQVLVIDLDVHQGNGTAEICRNDPRIFTFSMHGEKNYPMHKEKSDLDIGLPDGTGDTLYLEKLEITLDKLFEQLKPDFVFYQCGVDVLKEDKLGRLALSLEGCKERDRMVLKKCFTEKIPLTFSMGGGYSERMSLILEAHANTYRMAQYLYF